MIFKIKNEKSKLILYDTTSWKVRFNVLNHTPVSLTQWKFHSQWRLKIFINFIIGDIYFHCFQSKKTNGKWKQQIQIKTLQRKNIIKLEISQTFQNEQFFAEKKTKNQAKN